MDLIEDRDTDKPFCLSVFADNAGVDRLRRNRRRLLQGRNPQPPQRHRTLRRQRHRRRRRHPRHPRHRPRRQARRQHRRLLRRLPACRPRHPPQRHHPSQTHPPASRRRRPRLRQPHGNPHRQRRRLFRRPLSRQSPRLLRLRRPHPPRQLQKAAQPGDAIVVIGGRTGRDGIHGATFSSAELTDTHADEFSHAVQIGNAITEKKVADVILKPRETPTSSPPSPTAAPAASLSAVGEMAEKTGATVDLDKVPLKYAGLRYDEIWISEAQERMVLSVPPRPCRRPARTRPRRRCRSHRHRHLRHPNTRSDPQLSTANRSAASPCTSSTTASPRQPEKPSSPSPTAKEIAPAHSANLPE